MNPAAIRINSADLFDPADAAALIALLDSYAADPMGASSPLSATTRRDLVPRLPPEKRDRTYLRWTGRHCIKLNPWISCVNLKS